MRNSFLLAASLLGGVVLAVAACSDVATFADADNASGAPTTSNDRGAAEVAMDAGVPDKGGVFSPLCAVQAADCLPDDDGTFTPTSGSTCATPRAEYDGGADLPRYDNGCRLEADGPACLRDGGADRQGVDGVACTGGSDCAPGFDCVVGDTSRGAVCRRYCCAGSSACNDHKSQNGGRTFCDVQRLAERAAEVPVCMPIKQCTLLKRGECSATETCAVVSDRGETGCVAVGPQADGEPCERAHCADGLTCLGSPGARTCYTLCRASGPDDACDGARKCTTSSLFPDTSFGVCR